MEYKNFIGIKQNRKRKGINYQGALSFLVSKYEGVSYLLFNAEF
jgi:hypothetical protein